MKHYFKCEILEQPDLLEKNAEYWSKVVRSLRPIIEMRPKIVLLGRGSSKNACMFAMYMWGLERGLFPIYVHPWLATQHPKIPTDGTKNWEDYTVFAYSQSGESTDITQTAEWLRARGAFVVAITNSSQDDAALRKVADHHLFLNVGEERAVPASKTFMGQLLVTAALAGCDLVSEVPEIAECMRLYQKSVTRQTIHTYLESGMGIPLYWIARGPAAAVACDAALKFQEVACTPSFGFSSAEFLHGPIAMVMAHHRVVIFDDFISSSGGVRESTLDMVASSLTSRGINYLRVGEFPFSSGANLNISLPTARWARSCVFMYIAQLAALHLAEKNNLNPDVPVGLRKVTLT